MSRVRPAHPLSRSEFEPRGASGRLLFAALKVGAQRPAGLDALRNPHSQTGLCLSGSHALFGGSNYGLDIEQVPTSIRDTGQYPVFELLPADGLAVGADASVKVVCDKAGGLVLKFQASCSARREAR